MALRQMHDDDTRTRRVSVLVNDRENDEIETLARASGLSVSAFLRTCALGDNDSAAAMRQFDAALDRMEAALDAANTALAEANRRMAEMG